MVGDLGGKTGSNGVDVLKGVDIVGTRNILLDAKGEILCHLASLNGLDATSLEGGAKVGEGLIAVELCAMSETLSPGKDGSDGVCRSLFTLLMGTIVTSDGAVGSLRLDRLSIGTKKDGGHETERSKALSDGIGLNVTIIVFASPDKATRRFDGIGNHIIDETMFIPDASSNKLSLVLLIIDGLKDVLESTVILFEDRVLGAEVKRPSFLEGVNKAAVGKVSDRLVCVVHSNSNSSSGVVEDLICCLFASIRGGENDLKLSGSINHKVC